VVDTQREIESKFDVAPDFVIGDLTSLVGPRAGAGIKSDTVELVSSYFDTAEHDLLRSGMTLRRRTGEADTGWHLKVPGEGFRTELRWPLAGDDELPDELHELIRPFVGEADIRATITLRVRRTRHQLRDQNRRLILELADDQVRALPDRSPVAMSRWRELEVELGPAGTAADLDRAARLLRSRGAFASRAASKLMRGLQGEPVDLPVSDTAAAVLSKYLNTQFDALTAGHFAIALKPPASDRAAATAEPDEAVHQTRVATRRVRATLRVFAPLFDAERAARLMAELGWFAAELGAVRDRQVLRSRLARAVENLPDDLVVGPVAERIDELLLAELREHSAALLATMHDRRYRLLVADLASWQAEPAFSPAAAGPASQLTDQVAAADRKLGKRLKRAALSTSPDEDLHSARKAGKRARYAAEAAAPALGKRTGKLAKRIAKLQTLLGEHQDAVVAAELLRRVADQVAAEGHNAFSYGVLIADQRRIAADSARAARTQTRG
jgi:CHAD domain-containing protein